MSRENYVLITKLCSVYNVEPSFFNELDEIGLISIEYYDQQQYLPETSIGELEKMLRIRHDLSLNPEGIDVVFNLLRRIDDLQEELRLTRQQLDVFRNNHLWEEEF